MHISGNSVNCVLQRLSLSNSKFKATIRSIRCQRFQICHQQKYSIFIHFKFCARIPLLRRISPLVQIFYPQLLYQCYHIIRRNHYPTLQVPTICPLRQRSINTTKRIQYSICQISIIVFLQTSNFKLQPLFLSHHGCKVLN